MGLLDDFSLDIDVADEGKGEGGAGCMLSGHFICSCACYQCIDTKCQVFVKCDNLADTFGIPTVCFPLVGLYIYFRLVSLVKQ